MEPVALLGAAFVLAAFASAVYAGISAAPYLPTRWQDVRRALELAQVRPGETVVDLGCGDGRFLTEAARRGATAIGYEVSLLPFLWAWCRVHLDRRSRTRARVHLRSFYGADLASADVVIAFLTPPAMARLSTKVARELRPGARLLSVAFHLPGLTPVADEYPGGAHARIFLYRHGPG